jgi:hypothetical protein
MTETDIKVSKMDSVNSGEASIAAKRAGWGPLTTGMSHRDLDGLTLDAVHHGGNRGDQPALGDQVYSFGKLTWQLSRRFELGVRLTF